MMKLTAVLVTILTAGTAHADGLEVSIGLGAATSTGDVGDGMKAGDLIGSAGQVDLSIGGRVAKNLSLAFYANAQAGTGGAYTGAAGIAADLHLRPGREVDPFVRLGSGVRSYLVSDDGTTIISWPTSVIVMTSAFGYSAASACCCSSVQTVFLSPRRNSTLVGNAA
ncbi:MAG: hypothetical protein JNL83_11815, partial [Myxococcales bacterium]|nr:hypothetical protein [Myxococcales bacterium]